MSHYAGTDESDSGGVGLVETLPDQLQIFLGDPDAAVLDGNKKLAFLNGGFDADDGIVVAEFYGIVQQVIEHLLDFSHVRVYVHGISCQDQLDSQHFFAAGAFKGSGGGPYYLVDVKIRLVQQKPLGIQVV